MLSFLRFVVYNASDAILKEKVEATITSLGEDKFNGEITGSLSMDNELDVMKSIMKTIVQKQAGYETNLEQDTKLITEGKLTLNQRNCILIRMGDKEVMEWVLESSKFIYGFLELDYYEATQLLKDLPQEFESLEKYIRNIALPLIAENTPM
jgi:histone-lysine N-methyltransferase SETD3